MARRYCSVYKCKNNELKMKLWKDESCEEHEGLIHADCPCLQPYHFHRFPLKKKDLLRQWVKNINLQKFVPTVNSRVCSIHFVDGKPTEDNPVPQLHMGYYLKVPKPRKKIVKHPLPPKKNMKVQRYNFQSPTSSYVPPFTIPGNWETVTIKQEPLYHVDSEEVGQVSEFFPVIPGDDPLNLNSPDGTVTVKCEPILEEELLQPKHVTDCETMEEGESITPTIVNPELWNNPTQPTPHFISSNAICEAINNPARHSTMGTQAFKSDKDFRVEVTYKAKHHTDKKFQYYQCPQCLLFFNSLMLLREHMIGNSSESVQTIAV
ncbi:hypothetical protein B566_EDAN006050 [Ephemera danica]|nr:hypothetical protein B566_EDAN006050 [Ephemera danica]